MQSSRGQSGSCGDGQQQHELPPEHDPPDAPVSGSATASRMATTARSSSANSSTSKVKSNTVNSPPFASADSKQCIIVRQGFGFYSRIACNSPMGCIENFCVQRKRRSRHTVGALLRARGQGTGEGRPVSRFPQAQRVRVRFGICRASAFGVLLLDPVEVLLGRVRAHSRRRAAEAGAYPMRNPRTRRAPDRTASARAARANPHQLTIRAGLYAMLRSTFERVGVSWTTAIKRIGRRGVRPGLGADTQGAFVDRVP